jgi:hypothetical protein
VACGEEEGEFSGGGGERRWNAITARLSGSRTRCRPCTGGRLDIIRAAQRWVGPTLPIPFRGGGRGCIGTSPCLQQTNGLE